MTRLPGIALLAATLLCVAGCGGGQPQVGGGGVGSGVTASGTLSTESATTPSGSSPSSARRSACLELAGNSPAGVAVDWVDFVQLGGVKFLSVVGRDVPIVSADDLEAVVGRVTCQLSSVNFHTTPGPAVDGDAAYLPVGTELRAIRGFAPSCRVAVRIVGEIRVYLARLDPTGGAQVAPCAGAASGAASAK